MIFSKCQHCDKEFIVKVGTHGKFCSLSCSNFERSKKQQALKESKYNQNPNRCFHCKCILLYTKRKNKFCSVSCAAKVTNLVKRKRGPTPKEKVLYSKVKFLFCEKTKKWYCNRNPDGSYRKCSPYIKTEKEKYYNAAKFKFNVYNYPEAFDLDLINKFGWYSCPGKKRKTSIKNIDGVSRDHIISVSYGFKTNIDPKIISHPANCRIILHKKNKQKAESNNLSLEELLIKIDNWDRKYLER